MTVADHASVLRGFVEDSPREEWRQKGRAALDALQTQAALGEALEHVLKGWESAYPESVFPLLVEGELKHAMKLCNSEDRNQSARLYAEWARHIVGCIRDQAEATA